MDYLESLTNTVSNLTMYDVKDAFAKAKAVVMNYTEMEAKVREATNNDPWGASSSLMQEIAEATFNFQQFNEIMPTIYKRFTEKEAHEWRQIYKALQLLEYLIKHGSERVVDDARSHLSMIKMLRNFQYFDEKTGKDQGINVRQRAKEVIELLGDMDRLRQERRKAKSQKSKYVGQAGGGPSFTTAGGSKYGGFGSDAYFGSGGGGGESSHSRYEGGGTASYNDFQGGTRRDETYDEYDAGDDVIRTPPASTRTTTLPVRSNSASTPAPPKKDQPKPVAKPVVNAKSLFDFDFDDGSVASSLSPPQAAAPKSDDDFDDFVGGSVVAAPAASASKVAAKSGNLFDLLDAQPAPTASIPSAAPIPTNNLAYTQPISFSQPPLGSQPISSMAQTTMQPMGAIKPLSPSSTINVAKPLAPATTSASKSSDPFGDLFGPSLSSSTAVKPAPVSMAAMSQQSLWSNMSKPAAGAGGGGVGGLL